MRRRAGHFRLADRHEPALHYPVHPGTDRLQHHRLHQRGRIATDAADRLQRRLDNTGLPDSVPRFRCEQHHVVAHRGHLLGGEHGHILAVRRGQHKSGQQRRNGRRSGKNASSKISGRGDLIHAR